MKVACDTLTTCLEQKLIFITKTSNLTKQIEVRCHEDDINLDNLLEQRQHLFERLDKCDRLIHKTLEPLSEDNKNYLHSVIKGTVNEAELNANTRPIYNLSYKFKMILEDIFKDNKNAVDKLTENYNHAKRKVNELRNNKVS